MKRNRLPVHEVALMVMTGLGLCSIAAAAALGLSGAAADRLDKVAASGAQEPTVTGSLIRPALIREVRIESQPSQ